MTDSLSNEVPTEPATKPVQWFTAEYGRQVGPWSLVGLHERKRIGIIDGTTLVWSEGMSNWAVYDDLFAPAMPIDQEAGSAAPEFEPSASAMKERDVTPRAWRRWFARLVDIYLISIVLGVILAMTGTIPTNNLLWGIVGSACVALVEPLALHWFGATPGKGLMNIKVSEQSDERLSLRRAFARSLQTWSVGMGLGIPIVSLFTMSNQHRHLKQEGITSYDASLQVKVSHGPIGNIRVIGIVAFGFAVVGLIVVGTKM